MKNFIFSVIFLIFTTPVFAALESFPTCIDGFEQEENQEKLLNGSYNVSLDWSEANQGMILGILKDIDFKHIKLTGFPMHLDGVLILKFKINKVDTSGIDFSDEISRILSAEKELYSFYGLEGVKVQCNFPQGVLDDTLPSDTVIPFYN